MAWAIIAIRVKSLMKAVVACKSSTVVKRYYKIAWSVAMPTRRFVV